MRLTLIQPAIGHRPGESYIRSWQMEPLPIATLAGLTPAHVELSFHDDRLEGIPYDAPTDAVAIPVETYTARRAYQIASEYRRRGVPVILGGFHPSLVPDEAARFGEAIVCGEAEAIWPEVLDDLAHGRLQSRYQGERGPLANIVVDRSIFRGKRYLPIGLIETGRGCRFPCEFCAIQTFFGRSYRSRPAADVVRELSALRAEKKLFFFVDDNFAGDMKAGRELLPELAALKTRWITQISINAAHDEAFVAAMAQAGCRGVLIGFESLDADNLRAMNKRFNTMKTGYAGALANLRRHGIGVYGTFVFGYQNDTAASFDEAVDFALEQKMYLAAFNHLTPFPGTPLYTRLQAEGRLRFDAWWLDRRYRYNDLPFVPERLAPEAVTAGCVAARRRFYAWPNILRRSLGNARDAFMWRNFFPINAMHRNEVSLRNGYPLGDETAEWPLLECA
ncbi:MAG: radical SAM protein [Azonexus sp.]